MYLLLQMKIGILGSTRGTSCKYLIEESINGNINCKVEVIISNNKNAEILDKARMGNIDFIYLSNENYNDKLLKILKCYDLDIIFLVGYMKIIPKSINGNKSYGFIFISGVMINTFLGKILYFNDLIAKSCATSGSKEKM